MNVKSVLVGIMIAMVASTGTYFLAPPPRSADALAVKKETMEMLRSVTWNILEACSISDKSSIICDKKNYTERHKSKLKFK